jgi:hypothetical protein
VFAILIIQDGCIPLLAHIHLSLAKRESFLNQDNIRATCQKTDQARIVHCAGCAGFGYGSWVVPSNYFEDCRKKA